MKTHNLFISHSWTSSDSYDKLIGLIDARPYFTYRNYSVPKDDPIHNARSAATLKAAIQNKMSPCGVVLILAGVYATYSKWINIEIDLAQSGFTYPKPIVAIEPWASERTSLRVKQAADRIVRWNKDSVVKAIRELEN